MTSITALTRDRWCTKLVFVRNVTATLDEGTARRARLEAAPRDISVSSLLRELLRGSMGGQAAYAGAMERYLARPAIDLSSGSGYPTRTDLHDRAEPR